MQKNNEIESMSTTELINQLNFHATLLLKELHTAKDVLETNNRKIYRFNSVLNKYDLSVDVRSFANQNPQMRYNGTGSTRSPPPEDQRSELKALLEHLPHLQPAIIKVELFTEQKMLSIGSELVDYERMSGEYCLP